MIDWKKQETKFSLDNTSFTHGDANDLIKLQSFRRLISCMDGDPIIDASCWDCCRTLDDSCMAFKMRDIQKNCDDYISVKDNERCRRCKHWTRTTEFDENKLCGYCQEDHERFLNGYI